MERILGNGPANPSPAMQAFIDFVAVIPVPAIVGGRDVLLNSAQTKRRLKQVAPAARVKYLPDAGHVIINLAFLKAD